MALAMPLEAKEQGRDPRSHRRVLESYWLAVSKKIGWLAGSALENSASQSNTGLIGIRHYRGD
jgi:hypothetical protein